MSQQTCQTCRFWADRGHDVGECRRYAPRPLASTDDPSNMMNLVPFWPETYCEEWCGEHQPREDAP